MFLVLFRELKVSSFGGLSTMQLSSERKLFRKVSIFLLFLTKEKRFSSLIFWRCDIHEISTVVFSLHI